MMASKFAAEQWSGIAMDLSIAGVEDVCNTLGVMPDEVTLFCASTAATVAFKVRKALECEVILIPVEILKNPDVWAVRHNDRIIWMDQS